MIRDILILQTQLTDSSDPNKSKHTHVDLKDDCYNVNDESQLSKEMFDGIVGYSYSQHKINTSDFTILQKNAFVESFKWGKNDDQNLKKGIFGEVLLYLILESFYNANKFIARGYFYNPNENSETKGYDAFHFIENDTTIDLWFGEAKMYENISGAINLIFDETTGINKQLSDDYLNTNLLSLSKDDKLSQVEFKNSKLYLLLQNWNDKTKPIIDSLKNQNCNLILPILITYSKKDNEDYINSIKKAIELINTKSFSPSLFIPYKIFFILIPLDSVEEVKKAFIELSKK